MKLACVAAAYGLWLFAIEWVFYLVHGSNENALQLAVIGGIVPVTLQLLLLGLNPLGLVAPLKFSLALLLVILLSFLGHAVSWIPLVQVCNISFVLALAIIVAGSPDRRLLCRIAVIASLSIGSLLLYVNVTGEYLWGRLTAHGIQPNFWGTIGLAVALAGLAAKRPLVAGFGISAGLLTIHNASARGSLLGLVTAALVLIILSLSRLTRHQLVAAIVLTASLSAVVLAISPDLLIGDFVLSELKVDDPARGFGTGFSGRSEGWDEAFDIWLRWPLLGVGYHQHQQFMSGVSAGAHNAYLAILAETGIFGLLLYCGLLFWSFVAALPMRDGRTRRLIIGVTTGYAIYGFFEARAFNYGNPFSLLFLMCCFYALADQQRRRLAARVDRQEAVSAVEWGLPSEGAARRWIPPWIGSTGGGSEIPERR